MRHPGEPSVEEILESIKRVIAREDRGGSRMPATGADPSDRGSDGSDDDVLDLADHGYARAEPAPAETDAALVTQAVAANLRGSLDVLAAATGQRPVVPVPAPENAGLETLVRELLRPALAEWLDRNLPAIVERLVSAEVARIVGRRD